MTALGRRQRVAVCLWIVIAVVVWNGLYDELLAKRTQTYLFEQALHLAGQGPWVDLTAALDAGVRHAALVSTLWAGLLFCAGLATIRLVSGARP
jgi:hypothetical protein